MVLLVNAYDWSIFNEEIFFRRKFVMRIIECDTLALEVTRRCNMRCEHCMRGPAQKKDVRKEVVDAAFNNFSFISSLVITGGEPSMNIHGLQYIAKKMHEAPNKVSSLYMVTSGKTVSKKFLMTLVDLYLGAQAYEPEYNGLALSKDMFHEPIPRENEERLKLLSVFHGDDKDVDFGRIPLLNLGRARKLTGFEKREPSRYGITVEERENRIFVDGTITVTVDGDILSDCDYEYVSTDDIKIGNIFDPLWAEKLLEKTQAIA